MKNKLHKNAYSETPKPGKIWINRIESEKIFVISELLNRINPVFKEYIEIISANNNGAVLVNLLKDIKPSKRGELLLDFEYILKKKIDRAIYINVESMGDKSSLRNLRGIVIENQK